MFNSIRRNLSVLRIAISSPIHHNPCYLLQLNPFSSAIQKPNSDSTTHDPSIVVNYLVQTYGFSQQKAFRASKYMRTTSTTEIPELVRAFLENEGLTAKEIGTVVRYFPPILFLDPVKTLLPKVEFFRSLGLPQAEIKNIILTAPGVFKRNLTKHIIPSFSYIKTLFEASGSSLVFERRLALTLCCDIEAEVIPNVQTLREAGVPEFNIFHLLSNQPQALMLNSEKFRNVVEEVKQKGICPSSFTFVEAIHVLRSMKKSLWDTKVAAYMKWGWSEDDVRLAFEAYPRCMAASTDKIISMMNFLVNEMGFDSSVLSKKSSIFGYSLEKRIKPRCRVFKVLVENSLIKEDSYLWMFTQTEDKFLEKYVLRYEPQVPGLLQIYQNETVVSRVKFTRS